MKMNDAQRETDIALKRTPTTFCLTGDEETLANNAMEMKLN